MLTLAGKSDHSFKFFEVAPTLDRLEYLNEFKCPTIHKGPQLPPYTVHAGTDTQLCCTGLSVGCNPPAGELPVIYRMSPDDVSPVLTTFASAMCCCAVVLWSCVAFVFFVWYLRLQGLDSFRVRRTTMYTDHVDAKARPRTGSDIGSLLVFCTALRVAACH